MVFDNQLHVLHAQRPRHPFGSAIQNSVCND